MSWQHLSGSGADNIPAWRDSGDSRFRDGLRKSTQPCSSTLSCSLLLRLQARDDLLCVLLVQAVGSAPGRRIAGLDVEAAGLPAVRADDAHVADDLVAPGHDPGPEARTVRTHVVMG